MSNEILRVERLAMGAVGVDANVLFDSNLVNSDGINYDSATGTITLLEAGRYECSWWVATQSSVAVNGAVFGLVSSQGAVLRGNSPVKMGEVTGGGVIDVTAAPVTVELKNLSGAEYIFSTVVPAKAVLSIHSGTSPIAAYGGLYSNSLPSIPLSVGIEVQIPLTEPMSVFGMTAAANSLQILEAGDYFIKSMLIVQSGLTIVVDAGVRINGAFSDPSLFSTYSVGVDYRVMLLESIVTLQENDVLDMAIVSSVDATIFFGPNRDASLVVFRLN